MSCEGSPHLVFSSLLTIINPQPSPLPSVDSGWSKGKFAARTFLVAVGNRRWTGLKSEGSLKQTE